MRVDSGFRVAGDSHPGLQREVNEDRFHYDPARGIFMVVDGVGGHAAGEQAADIAVSMLRARLERETGPVAERIREAITIANNEIHRRASLRPEWKGMACVLTVAVLENGRAVVGHVGDTRLYKLRNGHLEKVTRDHSPVGEREDARELTEAEAMRHPRRNEVYRDVGSDPHDVSDPGFIDLTEVPFEPDAALLLCSDGLTDAVPSNTIGEVVRAYAGHPYEIVRALIDTANDAGGKDNVTVVYAEGPQFAHAATLSLTHSEPEPRPAASSADRGMPRWLTFALVLLLAAMAGITAMRTRDLWWPSGPTVVLPPTRQPGLIVVRPSESIGAALQRAVPGAVVVVEPGVYRERVRLQNGVTLKSRVPGEAVIRLPGDASEAEVAVMASDITGAEISGFKIIGDSATPLGTGVFVRDAEINISDVEISGAKNSAVEFSSGGGARMVGAEIHDNPGAGLAVRAGAAPRIERSRFARNGLSRDAERAVVIEPGARPQITGNIFVGIPASALPQDQREKNIFVAPEQPRRPSVPARPNGRGGRR
jgi:serine/threonine protein phosphatase PrpC